MWDTRQCASGRCTLDPAKAYRLHVYAATASGTEVELGAADLQVVLVPTRAQPLPTLDTQNYSPLIQNLPYVISFRIERGAVFVSGPSTEAQSIQTPVTPAGSSVHMVIPAGALSRATDITVLPAIINSGTNTAALVTGTAYEFGPPGTTFAAPVTVTIQYNPAAIPSGMAESTLRLFTLVNGHWVLVPGSSVNRTTHAVTGLTRHFSTYGVMASASVSAGGLSSCGVGTSAKAVCWGANPEGGLGDGTTTYSSTPVLVATAETFQSVSAGGFSSCGIAVSGVTYCWGGNFSGQLGNGSNTASFVPTTVAGGLSFQTVSVSGFVSDTGHACALTASGAAYCWGSGISGQLGTGSFNVGANTPQAVSGGLPFAGISAGGVHSCGVIMSGGAYCWGANFSGQLGDGTTTASATPVYVSFFDTLQAVTAGMRHSCGVSIYGTVYCWGANSNGQLGNGTTTDASSPVAISAPSGVSFVAVTAGGEHTCALATTGDAYCWGDNSSGQLGNGTTTSSTTPLAIPGIVFTSISAGVAHTCAIASAPALNTAYCWGMNAAGQLGTGTTTDSPSPVQVTTLP